MPCMIPYVVTSEKAIANVAIDVQFRISDPAAWLRSVSHDSAAAYDPTLKDDMRNGIFQQIAQRIIVAQVAKNPLDHVIRVGRADLERAIQKAFQESLDHPDQHDPTKRMGVTITSVSLSAAEVPDRVKPFYTNLITQMNNAQTVRTNAQTEADSMVTAARGETSSLVSDAKAYAQKTIQGAQGEADRFKQVYAQYLINPQMSRTGVWIDAARTVYSNVKRIYIARPGQRTVLTIDAPQFDSTQIRP